MVCWFEAASTHNLMQMVVTALHTTYGQNISWSPSNANAKSDDISGIMLCFASMGDFDHHIKLGQCLEGFLLPDYHTEQLELGEHFPVRICDCDYDYVILWILYDSECWSSCILFSHALLIVIIGIAQSSMISSVVVVVVGRAGLVQAVESYCLWPEGPGFESRSSRIAQASVSVMDWLRIDGLAERPRIAALSSGTILGFLLAWL